jgi:protein subunit release factor A
MRKSETRSRESSYREALDALTAALEAEQSAQSHRNENRTRKQQVGSGMRGDKRRTYRFQDDIVVDHVTGKSARCSDAMRGMMDRLW